MAAVVTVTLAGRLRSMRPMGKITFAHIEDGEGRVQLFLRANEVGEEALDLFTRQFDLGDFIQASGEMFRTRTGESDAAGERLPHAGKVDHAPAGRQRRGAGRAGRAPRHAERRRDALPPALRRPGDQPGGAPDLPHAGGGGAGLAQLPGRARFPGSGDAHPAADLRRRGGAALHHAPQPAQARPVPAHLLRAVPEAPAGGEPGAGVRDRARFPQRGRRPHAQPGVHPARVLLGVCRLPAGDGADRANDRICRRPGAGQAYAHLPGRGDRPGAAMEAGGAAPGRARDERHRHRRNIRRRRAWRAPCEPGACSPTPARRAAS